MFSPRWIVGHLLALIGILLFVLLGFWQLRRHSEKVELRDAVQAAIEADPVALPNAGGAFTHVAVQGEFLAGDGYEARVLRSRDGVSGYAVLSPLVLEDGTALLVERGWVRLDIDHRQGGMPPHGQVDLVGVLWPAQSAGLEAGLTEFLPSPDPTVFERALGIEFRAEYLIATEQSPPFGITLRAPEVGEVSLGPHLGYAGQWFLFAAVVLVGYPILLRRRFGSSSTPG